MKEILVVGLFFILFFDRLIDLLIDCFTNRLIFLIFFCDFAFLVNISITSFNDVIITKL